MKLPTLYGYDSKGKVKQWSVEASGADVIVKYGLLDGKITESITTSSGKNLGRSNETTPEEQAIKDAQSKWNKQIDKNYHEDLNDYKPLENPMLALDYHSDGHRIEFPCIIQPKLDGVRCLVKDGCVLKSKGNKEHPNIPHLMPEIKDLYDRIKADYGEVLLDGELYIHGETLQDIGSAVKKPNELTERLTFQVFDAYFYDHPDMGFQDRLTILEKFLFDECYMHYYEYVECVGWLFFNNQEGYDIDYHHDNCAGVGYEGIMLRNINSVYRLNTRSADLQKYKKMQDSEFLCVHVLVDKKGQGVLVLSSDGEPKKVTEDNLKELLRNKEVFKASFKGTEEFRKTIADKPEEWIGEQITIQYQALTKDNIPQFPVAIARRDYE